MARQGDIICEGAYKRFVVVVPGTPLTYPSDALWVGVAGDLQVTGSDGAVVVLKGAPVGVNRVSTLLVVAALTTATNIVACYYE